MNENFEEYRDLVQLMRAAPKISTSSLLTEKVLDQVPGKKYERTLESRFKLFYYNMSGAGIRSFREQIFVVSNRDECSFCFFITGYFYLGIGLVLLAGLKATGLSTFYEMNWIGFQPQITIGASIWLLVLGMVILMRGKTAMKVAKYAMFLYTSLIVFNGVMMWPYLRAPFVGIVVTGFVSASLVIAAMLALAVERIDMRTK